jgi:hypothetical protein
MKSKVFLTAGVFLTKLFFGQVDTINTDYLKLNLKAFKTQKSTYCVFIEDTTGKRLTSGELWDRKTEIRTDNKGQQQYAFYWKAYSKDSLRIDAFATGQLPSFKPLTHEADYFRFGKKSVVFDGNVVTVPEKDRKTAKDSAFRVEMNPPAYEFPMDMELFGLLPYKKVGQTFAMAFYEPGSKDSKYYNLTVSGFEDLVLPGGAKVKCWLLRIDYMKGVYAVFWISDKTREVLKMREQFKKILRYKVKLY